MKILKLTASNVKRLSAVEIEPDGSLVIIGGRNAQGKSSVLDAIMYALAGASTVPAEPIRKGARRARTTVELDDGLKVERTFDHNGTRLVVTDENGVKRKSPQKLLDELCGKIAFDPLEYSRMDARKQAETLRQLLDLDTSELDELRAEKFATRTELNRLAKDLKARLKAAPRHDDAPKEEVDVAALTEELERRREIIVEHDRAKTKLGRMYEDCDEQQEHIIEIDDDIAELEEQLRRLRVKRDESNRKLDEMIKARDEHEKHCAELVYPDLDEVRDQLRGAQDVNRKVRDNRAAHELRAKLQLAESDIEKLTDEIADIDDDKRKTLERAEFPIRGLGFDEDGVTLNSVPLEQASQAERLRVSVAIGIAMNPTLRVLLIRDGSLLDEDSLAMVAKMADDADAQVWLEVVTTDDERATVIIEDGAVREREAADV